MEKPGRQLMTGFAFPHESMEKGELESPAFT